MKLRILAIATLLATTGLIAPVKAQQEPAFPDQQLAPEPTAPTTADNPVIDACINNRAETLPIPFSDVSPNDWAFKAVMTMYYCGAFRQATPPELFEQLRPTRGQIPRQNGNAS